MDKTLQDLIWSVLPKDFKEELKKEYLVHQESGDIKYSFGYNDALTDFFGDHNLTSDSDREEMLVCHKEQVCKFYSHLLDLVEKNRTSKYYSEWCDLEREYIALFGDKPFSEYFES